MASKTNPEAKINPLRELEGDKCFWINNGPVIKNLYELRDALKVIDEGIFSYHVNGEKNDFYNWVKYAVQDDILAERLGGLKTREEMARIIENRIKKLRQTRKARAKIKAKTNKEKSIRSPQKIAIKRPKEIHHASEASHISHAISSRPTIIGTAIAAITLFVVVGAISLSKAVITGATITDLKSEASPIAGIIIVAIVVLAILIKKIKR